MLFSSLLFLFCFLPITLLLYKFCPRGKKNIWKNAVLFVVSIIFYAWGEPVYIFLMLFTILHNYIFALFIDKYKPTKPKTAKILLTVSVILNLGFLGFFKYCNFFIGNLNNIFGLDIALFSVALPIGISFYTFQTMSYTIDVYRGNAEVQKNIISFGAYVTLFPQLIAGPIVQYKTIEYQLDYRTEKDERFGNGVKLFTVGLAKKVLIANSIGALWDNVIALPQSQMTVLTAWLGIIAFAFQIYYDFSGYSDMAIGLGRIFGFEFDKNFDYPYISTSVTEFWRRWHISLGTWFKEYLYFPLGGNRVPEWRYILNMAIVWFCTGFWHGAGWNFIIWGLYFCVFRILEKRLIRDFLNKIPKFFSHLYLILIVLVGWVFFAIEDMPTCFNYLKIMFGFGGVPFADGRFLYLLYTNAILIIVAIICSTPFFENFKNKLKDRNKPIFAVSTVAACLIAWFITTASLVSGSYNPFLYFRF